MIIVELREKPWTMNDERTKHWRVRAERTRHWRNSFYYLALQAMIGRKRITYRKAEITVEHWQSKGKLADVCAVFPAAKVAIDGLVDAGLIPDDGPKYLASVTYKAPQRGADALRLIIKEIK